jgi:hypothetical protein
MENKDIEKDVIGIKTKVDYIEKSVNSINCKLEKHDVVLNQVSTLDYQMKTLIKNIEKLNTRIDKLEEADAERMKEKEKRIEQNKNEAIMTVVRTIISICVGAIIGKYI